MINPEELKAFQALEDLSDDKLEKLAAIAKEVHYVQNDVVFRECEIGDALYFLKQGKILLERDIKPKVTLALGAVHPGMPFGWTSLKSKGLYSWSAVCDEDSTVFVFDVDELRNLCDLDNVLGYLLLKNLMINIKSRLDFRTEQLLRVIRNHPQIKFD